MRVDCSQCGKVINIPAEKVPERAFAFSCPACQGRITVEPPAAAAEIAASPPSVGVAKADQAEGSPTSHEASQPADVPTSAMAGADTHQPAPGLKGHERELLASLAPLAYVVELGCSTDGALDSDLEAMGMQDIQRYQDLDSAVQNLLETEVGILVIAVPKAAAPPFEPLQPLATIPSRMRRRTFVVLTAANVTSLDGQVAFFLQVNCLINSNEIDRRRGHLQRALLHHLKLYQHWTMDPA